MTNNRALITSCCRLTLLAGFALWMAPGTGAAQAQSGHDQPAAASTPDTAASKPDTAAKPGGVGEVTVTGTRPRAIGIPPAKAADLAADPVTSRLSHPG